MKKKIMLVFGTRPEAIKMAPLVKEFQKYPDDFETIVCVTAQHRKMLDQVLQLFEIVPDHDLNIMKAGQDLYDVTSRVLLGMRDVLKETKPDIVLVHGDTSTSTAAALAAFYQKIPVGHVEAGLRTHNIYSPWPEEMNRQITSRIATYHFAPTYLSRQNLLDEGVEVKKIYITGNTVIDALHWVLNKLHVDQNLEQLVISQLVDSGIPHEKIIAWKGNLINEYIDLPTQSTKARALVLITGHRRENFGQGFLNICEAINELASTFPNVDFVYPMHLNPNVRNAIKDVFGDISEFRSNSYNTASNINFIEPLFYLPFIYLMNLSFLVLTDSGGIQEEAPSLCKPVLVMRDTTERPEALEAGTVRLVGTDKQRIIEEVSLLVKNNEYYASISRANNPYGNGQACIKICKTLQ
jgi:UDP-N-acetylglucosamine 2-epimerase (non-hydrolysing)